MKTVFSDSSVFFCIFSGITPSYIDGFAKFFFYLKEVYSGMVPYNMDNIALMMNSGDRQWNSSKNYSKLSAIAAIA